MFTSERSYRRSDLQRDDVITETSECHGNNSEETMIVPCIAPNEL